MYIIFKLPKTTLPSSQIQKIVVNPLPTNKKKNTILFFSNIPINNKNSPINPIVPGNEILQNEKKTKKNEKIGIH